MLEFLSVYVFTYWWNTGRIKILEDISSLVQGNLPKPFCFKWTKSILLSQGRRIYIRGLTIESISVIPMVCNTPIIAISKYALMISAPFHESIRLRCILAPSHSLQLPVYSQYIAFPSHFPIPLRPIYSFHLYYDNTDWTT